MELKEFIKKVIADAIQAVDEISADSIREVKLTSKQEKRTIEFDVAVTAEENISASGGAGVKVLNLLKAGAEIGSETKNSTVSRISFGVDVASQTKVEAAQELVETNQRVLEQRIRNRGNVAL